MRPLPPLFFSPLSPPPSFEAPDGSILQMRIGIASGPAVGGVVGASMLRCGVGGWGGGRDECISVMVSAFTGGNQSI